MVQRALSNNQWLNSQGVEIVPQGSFANRTAANENDKIQ